MKFDFGKFDYVVHEGNAVLLDANKTIGCFPGKATSSVAASRRHRAAGIYSYFDRT